MLDNRKTMALIGAALLLIGAFLPIVSLPMIGSMDYFQNGRGDGIFAVGLAVIGGVLALTGLVRHVLWPGLAALALILFTFVNMQSKIGQIRGQLGGNPLAEAMVGSVQLQWGFAVLFIGAALMTAAGAMAWRRPPPPTVRDF